MLDIGILILSLGIILVSAELFTNGVEWLGRVLKLSEGAIGSLLAAVGTALPETLIPIIAIVFGHDEAATEIGIGAILGAPFMLGTLALFVTGTAAIVLAILGKRRIHMKIDTRVLSRDMGFFLVVYSCAILAALLTDHRLKFLIACGLVLAYLIYAYRTVMGGEFNENEQLGPLIIARRNPRPSLFVILLQLALALGGIILGAEIFIGSVQKLAVTLGIPAFILSIIVTPIATELPEKFNSIIWVSKNKDTLALGNITGAMVFQSSVIPAIGIALTPWVLTPMAFISAILVVLSILVIFLSVKKNLQLRAYTLLSGGIFYSLFLYIILSKKFF